MYEFANILHLKVRRGQSSIDEAWAAFTELIGFDIEFIDMESIHARAIELATQRVGRDVPHVQVRYSGTHHDGIWKHATQFRHQSRPS